jgi:PKD repeat protein
LMKPALTASFDPSPASALVGAQVSFPTTTADPYGNLNLAWSFGDGGTGVGPSPSHAYAASGDYTVTMTATDPLTGAMTPVSHTVIVSEAPAASSTSSPNLLAAGAATTGGSTAIPPNSDFTALANAGVNARTGAITFRLTVGDPGSFSWMLTFKNGQFGAFSAKSTRCKAAHVKINGRCAPAELVFGQGSQAVASPGAVTFTVDPSRSAIRALEDALGQRKGVPVTATLSFQSSHGGLPVSHTQLLSVKLVAMAHQRRSGR